MSNIPIVALKNIYKDYRQARSVVEVLKNVNLKLYSGQTIAITGASGSGKSTLLHIASLLDSPDKGHVEINGVPSSKTSSHNWHKLRSEYMGFIYQNHNLLSDFTARENAAMPLLIKGVSRSDALCKAEKLLDQLGLGKRLYNLPGELSGGEQQRVAIARALINNPKIILADEPTGNLDPNTASEVFAMFMERAANLGTAIIMVSHNLELASKMDRVLTL